MPGRSVREYLYWITAIALLLCVIAAVGVVLWRLEPMGWVDFILHRETQPLLFLVLWAILPIFGFPVTVFLVLAGLKFGIAWGVLLTGLIMPIHMIASYVLARSFLYKPLLRLLQRRGYSLPDLSSRRVITAMIVFLSLPGPSYALKNYLLALVDIPFMRYLSTNWCIQGIMMVPVIGLSGAAVEKKWGVFSLFVLVVIALLLIRWYFKRKRSAESP